MLNKKCLFGGLYLVNIIAIFASTSNNVIARTSIHDFRSELNQISWEADCSQREDNIRNYEYYKAYNDYNEHSWILGKDYEESRARVIGKAIGDCVANKEEFKGKKADNIITFEKTLPEWYEQKNWNAVILYNYVHEAISRSNLLEDPDKYYKYASSVKEVLKNKLKKIKDYYIDYYQKHIKNNVKKLNLLLDSLKGNLNNAVNDIQKYVNALKLNESLFLFRKCKLKNKLAPHLELNSYKLNEGAEFFSEIVLTDEKYKNKPYYFWPTICCYDNQLCIVRLEYEEHQWGTDGNNRITQENTKIQELEEFLNKGKLLLERLKGLVELPTEELWNKWNPKEEEK